MSEYQYYEFLAVDRPLYAKAQSEVRALSTRARITATSFVNEYHWGDFRGSPDRLMERHYDAHLYLANWGTRRVMFCLPASLLDLDAVEPFLVGDAVIAWTSGRRLVLALTSEDEPGDWDYEPQGSLSAIVGVRGELAAGDHRGLYLAWLAGFGAWERDEHAFDTDADEELEPPVPAGLGTLTAPQRELADFLRLDDELLAVAAEASPPLGTTADDPALLAAWAAKLPAAAKNRLLLRVARDDAAAVRMEMLRRFRNGTALSLDATPRRTVANLLDGAARRRAERQRQEAARRADEEARRESAQALARERRLAQLARDEEAAWARVEALIATRKPAEYDAAVTLLDDLRSLAARDARPRDFTRRYTTLRRSHARKPSLLGRMDRANL